MEFHPVLLPYKQNCRYLTKANLRVIKDSDSRDIVLAEGHFSITESCYISQTGHFNSVEFNICFNQLAYFLFYECIQQQCVPWFKNWSIDAFTKYQLSSMFILKFQSSFHKRMSCKNFNGVLQIASIKKVNIWLHVKLYCSFTDENGHSSSGKIKCAIPAIPASPKILCYL
jgi:hypothetical protein